MSKLYLSAMAVAKASNGNPIISTITVMIFYIMFNMFEAGIETLLYGDRFNHWLDPIFQLCFIGYSAYCVWMCAVVNTAKERALRIIDKHIEAQDE